MTNDVDYGWWLLPNGQHARVSWNEDTCVLYMHWPGRGDEALTTCATREDVDALLHDRDELQQKPGGLTTLRLRIVQDRKRKDQQ